MDANLIMSSTIVYRLANLRFKGVLEDVSSYTSLSKWKEIKQVATTPPTTIKIELIFDKYYRISIVDNGDNNYERP